MKVGNRLQTPLEQPKEMGCGWHLCGWCPSKEQGEWRHLEETGLGRLIWHEPFREQASPGKTCCPPSAASPAPLLLSQPLAPCLMELGLHRRGGLRGAARGLTILVCLRSILGQWQVQAATCAGRGGWTASFVAVGFFACGSYDFLVCLSDAATKQ